MNHRLMSLLEPVLEASSAEGASLAFHAMAKQAFGATYLQTRLYQRPAGPLTPAAHWKAGGFITRMAPPGWVGSPAFDYVCLGCNPLVEAIRCSLTRYRFSDFAPRGASAYGEYWEAMSEAGIADAHCATAYARGGQIASLHLGFATAGMDNALEPAIRLAGAVLVEKLIAFAEAAPIADRPPLLSQRERDSLSFVAEGKTDWEIAVILGISEATARFHVDNARRKLGAVNRAHAVARFLSSGAVH